MDLRRYLFKIFSASFFVVLSKTVGPEATFDKSLPQTSDTIRETTFAGQAIFAKLPPLKSEKCFLTVFNSEIAAPALVNSFIADVVFFNSALEAQAKAEPPPQIKVMSKSFSFKLFVNLIISCVAFIFCFDGRG